MNAIWVATDWHLWDVKHKPQHPFRTNIQLNKICDQCAENIEDSDIFIHLGDLCDPNAPDAKKLKEFISRIPGYKVLCKGNYDTADDSFYLDAGFDEVCEICKIHNIIFSHKPVKVEPDELNVHGHLHTEWMSALGYQHVNAYATNIGEDQLPHAVELDDLLASATVQKDYPKDHWVADKKYIEKINKYTSLDGEFYNSIIDLTDRVGIYPMDEDTKYFDFNDTPAIESIAQGRTKRNHLVTLHAKVFHDHQMRYIVSMYKDVLDSAIHIAPYAYDKTQIATCKNANELIAYFNSLSNAYAKAKGYSGNFYAFANANVSAALFNKDKIYNHLIPTDLSDDEFKRYIDNAIQEMDRMLEILLECIKTNYTLFGLTLSEANEIDVSDISRLIDSIDSNPPKGFVEDKNDGTKIIHFDKLANYSTMYISKTAQGDAYKPITPSRYLLRAHEYKYIIITHGIVTGNKKEWVCDPIMIDDKQFTSIPAIVDHIIKVKEKGDYNTKILIMTCNPNMYKFSKKYHGVEYGEYEVYVESAMTVLSPRQELIRVLFDWDKYCNTLLEKFDLLKKWTHMYYYDTAVNHNISKHYTCSAIAANIGSKDITLVFNQNGEFLLFTDTLFEAATSIILAAHDLIGIINDKITMNESGAYHWYENITNGSTGGFLCESTDPFDIAVSEHFEHSRGYHTLQECINEATLRLVYGYNTVPRVNPIFAHGRIIDDVNFNEAVDTLQWEELDEVIFDSVADTEYFENDDEYEPARKKKETMAEALGDDIPYQEINPNMDIDEMANMVKSIPYDNTSSIKRAWTRKSANSPEEYMAHMAVYYNDDGTLKGYDNITSQFKDALDTMLYVNPEDVRASGVLLAKNANDLISRYWQFMNSDDGKYNHLQTDRMIRIIVALASHKDSDLEGLFPINLTGPEFDAYLHEYTDRCNELLKTLCDCCTQNLNELLHTTGESHLLEQSDDEQVITKLKKYMDKHYKDIDNFYYKNHGTICYDFARFGGGRAYIAPDMGSEFDNIIAPSRFFVRSRIYQYIIMVHGIDNDEYWECKPIYIDGIKFTNVQKIVDRLRIVGANNIRLMICNPNGHMLELQGDQLIRYARTNIMAESANELATVNMLLSYDPTEWRNTLKRAIKSFNKITDKLFTIAMDNDMIVYPSTYRYMHLNKSGELTYKESKLKKYEHMLKDIFTIFNRTIDIMQTMYNVATAFTKSDRKYIPEVSYLHGMLSYGNNSCTIPSIIGEATIEDCCETAFMNMAYSNLPYIAGASSNLSGITICENGTAIEFTNINELSINEAGVKSKLNKNFKPKERIQLSSLKKIQITESIIDKYKKEYPDLKHVRCKDTKEYKCDGYMWFDKDKLVCHVGSCEYNDDHTKWIVSLEILPEYKGHGLSEQIVDYAVKTMGCNYLSVAKNNDIAKHVYDKYGFKVYQEDDHMYYMQYKHKMNESTTPYINMLSLVEDTIQVPKKAPAEQDLYPVYTILFSNDTDFGKLIRKATGSEYSHAVIALDSSMNNMYSFSDIPYAHSFDSAGFVRESLWSPMFKKNRYFTILVTFVSKEDRDQIQSKIDYFCKNYRKYKYNDIGLVKYYFNFKETNNKKYNEEKKSAWFCSEFVSYMLKIGNVSAFNDIMLAPEDIHNISDPNVINLGNWTIPKFKEADLIRKTEAAKKQYIKTLLNPTRIDESAYYYDSTLNEFALTDIIKKAKREETVKNSDVFPYTQLIDWKGLYDEYLKLFPGSDVDVRFDLFELIVKRYLIPFKRSAVNSTEEIITELRNIYKSIGKVIIDSVDLINSVIHCTRNSKSVAYSYPTIRIVNPVNESAYDDDDEPKKDRKNQEYMKTDDNHQMTREEKTDTFTKYGLNPVGQDVEQIKNEKRQVVEDKVKKRNKQLAKARKIKKRKAVVRKIKSKLPGVKNEDAETVAQATLNAYNDEDKNPLWGDSIRFFNHPDQYTEISETVDSYKFAVTDHVLFGDRMNESSGNKTLYPVYILITHNKRNILSSAIKAVTGAEYTHASISFDSSMKTLYTISRKGNSPFDGGFNIDSIDKNIYPNYDTPYALYMVPVTEDELNAMKKRVDYFAKNNSKITYDFIGIFKNALGIADDPKYRWFCSRLVADILNAGRPKSDPYIKEPSLMKPNDYTNTDFAIYVAGGDKLAKYDRKFVDNATKRILREEKLRRVNDKTLELNEDNPYSESVLKYQLTMMDESAVDDFIKYLGSFKIKVDANGNVLISRREYDQLAVHFHNSLKVINACEKAGNVEGVKEELYKIKYMIDLIQIYYLTPGSKNLKDNTTKDLRKEMMDLRSVMINAMGQHLKYVTVHDPKWNFQQGYATSKYGNDMMIPKNVITAIGKAIITKL